MRVLAEGQGTNGSTPPLPLAEIQAQVERLGKLQGAGQRAIVRTYHAVPIDGRVALVTEHVRGHPVRALLGDPPEPLPPRSAYELIAQVAAGLEAAWSTSVAGKPLAVPHRDVRPRAHPGGSLRQRPPDPVRDPVGDAVPPPTGSPRIWWRAPTGATPPRPMSSPWAAPCSRSSRGSGCCRIPRTPIAAHTIARWPSGSEPTAATSAAIAPSPCSRPWWRFARATGPAPERWRPAAISSRTASPGPPSPSGANSKPSPTPPPPTAATRAIPTASWGGRLEYTAPDPEPRRTPTLALRVPIPALGQPPNRAPVLGEIGPEALSTDEISVTDSVAAGAPMPWSGAETLALFSDKTHPVPRPPEAPRSRARWPQAPARPSARAAAGRSHPRPVLPPRSPRSHRPRARGGHRAARSGDRGDVPRAPGQGNAPIGSAGEIRRRPILPRPIPTRWPSRPPPSS